VLGLTKVEFREVTGLAVLMMDSHQRSGKAGRGWWS
jgi:hypothetical protein